MIVRDSRLPPEHSDASRILVTEGPSSVTYQTVSAADRTSLTPVFNIEPPSQLTGVQRQLYWRATGTFTVTGTNLEQLRLGGERIAFRQFPLQSMCSNVEVQMNDTTLSIGSLNQIIHGLLRKGNPVKASGRAQSSTPSMFDTVADYEFAVGRRDSPFAAVGDRMPSGAAASSRTIGITGITEVGGPPATSLQIAFTVEEPLIIPPFTYTDDGRNKALYGLNQVQVSCNISLPQRGLSLALQGTTATITGTTVAFTDQALLCTFVTPNDRSLALAVKEAKMFRYDCPRVQLYATESATAIAASTEITGLTSNSFQLPVVPEAIMIWVQPLEAYRNSVTASPADFFLPITALQCQAGTRAGLLSGATAADLWAMSNRNGADIPYWMYRGLPQISSVNSQNPANQAQGSGGPVILNVARDLSLPEGVVPGMSINWTFGVTTLSCRNPSVDALAGSRVMVVPIMPGVLTNQGGSSSVCIGGVPGIDAAKLPAAPKMLSMEFNELTADGGFGGAIQGGSRIGDWFKHLGAQIKHSAYKTGDALKHAAYKAANFAKHEAYKAGDIAKDAAYKLGHAAEGVVDHAIQSAAHGVASSVTGHGYGGRRMPRSMLYS